MTPKMTDYQWRRIPARERHAFRCGKCGRDNRKTSTRLVWKRNRKTRIGWFEVRCRWCKR